MIEFTSRVGDTIDTQISNLSQACDTKHTPRLNMLRRLWSRIFYISVACIYISNILFNYFKMFVLFVFISAAFAASNSTEELLFKCPPSKSWLINVIVGLVALILILLGAKHETVKALLGPRFSWLVQWRRPVLSRSSETSSSDDSKTDCSISENSKSIHFA